MLCYLLIQVARSCPANPPENKIKDNSSQFLFMGGIAYSDVPCVALLKSNKVQRWFGRLRFWSNLTWWCSLVSFQSLGDHRVFSWCWGYHPFCLWHPWQADRWMDGWMDGWNRTKGWSWALYHSKHCISDCIDNREAAPERSSSARQLPHNECNSDGLLVLLTFSCCI